MKEIDECSDNKEAWYPVEQKQPIQQSQSSQAKRKKKREKKNRANKPAQGNFADEENVHHPASQVTSLSDINIRNNKHGNAKQGSANTKINFDSALTTSFRKENNNNKDTTSHENSQNERPTSAGTEHWKRNTVLIAGDSMLTKQRVWTLSRRYTTKVRCFRGSTIEDLHDYIRPLLRKKSDKIILVIGTNDTENKSVEGALKGIKDLLDMMLEKLPKCHIVVSEIIKRAGKCKATTNEKINKFNSKLKRKNVDILRQQKILQEHINQSGLHLNRRGDGQLARNNISKLSSFPSL